MTRLCKTVYDAHVIVVYRNTQLHEQLCDRLIDIIHSKLESIPQEQFALKVFQILVLVQ